MSAAGEIVSQDHMRHYMWEDTSVFEKRFRKSAVALAAIHKFVADHQPLNGAAEEKEFLDIYDQVSKMSDESFSIVWQDPLSYGWTMTVFDMLPSLDMLRLRGQETGKQDWKDKAELVEKQVTDQLNFFKLFAMSIAVLSKHDLVFETPLAIDLPISLPGTTHLLQGELDAEIMGLRDSVLTIRKDGENFELALNEGPSREFFPVRLAETPTITTGGTNIRIDCFDGRFPHYSFEEGQTAHAAHQPIGPKQRNILEQAVHNFERFYPEGFDQFSRWLRVLQTKTPWSAGFDGQAGTNMPGLISHRMGNSVIWLSEILVHEFYHNRLFFLDEDVPMLDFNPGPLKYYHSWRTDARPPLGALHATYVFIPVTKFFLRIHNSGIYSGVDADYIEDFTSRTSMKLLQAVDSIRQIEELTAQGKAFVEMLAADVDEVAKEVRKNQISLDKPALKYCPRKDEYEHMLSLSSGKPMSSRDALIDHIENSEVGHQVKHWIDKIKTMPYSCA